MKRNEQMKINALCVAYSKLAAQDADGGIVILFA